METVVRETAGTLIRSASPYENLRLLEHTKERIERNLLQPSAPQPPPSHAHPAQVNALPDHAAYSSIPAVKSAVSETASPPPRQVVTAPIVSKSVAAHAPPSHVHMMGNHWQCEACTSFNLQGTEICDICGKSRLKGAEQMPLVSGGPQCPKCTLINDIGASLCEACDYSFDKGVPTYI